jgi:hypothetical protein
MLMKTRVRKIPNSAYASMIRIAYYVLFISMRYTTLEYQEKKKVSQYHKQKTTQSRPSQNVLHQAATSAKSEPAKIIDPTSTTNCAVPALDGFGVAAEDDDEEEGLPFATVAVDVATWAPTPEETMAVMVCCVSTAASVKIEGWVSEKGTNGGSDEASPLTPRTLVFIFRSLEVPLLIHARTSRMDSTRASSPMQPISTSPSRTTLNVNNPLFLLYLLHASDDGPFFLQALWFYCAEDHHCGSGMVG